MDMISKVPTAYNPTFSMGSVSSENKKRAFGVDLEEHLAATKKEVPLILTECVRSKF